MATGERRAGVRCSLLGGGLGRVCTHPWAPGRKHEVQYQRHLRAQARPNNYGTVQCCTVLSGARLQFSHAAGGWMPWISQSAWVTDWHLGLSVRSRRARNKAAACTSVISYGTLRDKPVRSYGTVLIVQPDTSCTDGLVDDGQYWTVLNCFPVRNSASLNPITGWWTVLDSN